MASVPKPIDEDQAGFNLKLFAYTTGKVYFLTNDIDVIFKFMDFIKFINIYYFSFSI